MKTPITLDVRPRIQELADALDVTPADAMELRDDIEESLRADDYKDN